MRAFIILGCAVAFLLPMAASQASEVVEGVFFDPDSGNFRINYPAFDADDRPYLDSVVFVPATKVAPVIKSQFLSGTNKFISYRFHVSNGPKSEQPIVVIRLKSAGESHSQSIPDGWSGNLQIDPSTGMSSAGWSRSSGHPGLRPGSQQMDFGIESSRLPGVAWMEVIGQVPVIVWGGEIDPGSQVGRKLKELQDNDFVRIAVAAPMIPVSSPFDIEMTLSGMQAHIKEYLLPMGLVDRDFAGKLDTILQSAIQSARGGEARMLASHLRDFRQVIQRASPGVELDGEGLSEGGRSGNPNHLIDRLAARVLFFDIKYVEGQL